MEALENNNLGITVKALWKSRCGGKKNGNDFCNCFLHSYSLRNATLRPNGTFEELEPFIIYVSVIHDFSQKVDLTKVKAYAKTFTGPITFVGANW